MKTTLFTLLFLLCCGETFSQRKQLFDYDWKFFLGDDSKASATDYNDNVWRKLDLPHDWSIEGKVRPKNPMGGAGGYFPAGIGWYRKSFSVPAELQGKRVSVYFEGVYTNAEVFINGKSLGIHPYGYTSFRYDISSYMNFNKENTIAVRVDNAQQQNCRWYSGSGIYRHVWLEVKDNIHIADWGVTITTPEVSPEKATVLLKTIIKNETSAKQSIAISTLISGKNSVNVGKNEQKLEIEANSEKEIIQTISVKKPLLWSPESPDLYNASVSIMKDGKEMDKVVNSFGIRSIKFSVEKGFELNGKTVKLNGGCVHHDNGCLGATAFDRAEERRIELLKAAGFNAIRTSHNPPSEAFLEACDRLGMMVIDEAFDGWRDSKTTFDYAKYFDEWSERDLSAMVLRDKNHPSIIMWSIGNEIIERKKPEAVETAKRLAGIVHKLDLTRPVTSAMTTWDADWEIFDPLMAVHDVGGYNYQLHRAEADHKRVPSRIIVQTESYPREAFQNWNTVDKNSYVIGDFVWTALDYLGESGIGRWYYSGDVPGEHWERDLFPWHGAYCGDVDLIGWRKPISHYRNLLYSNTEKLYMAVREPNPEPLEIKETMWSVYPTWESWTWNGLEGKEIQVEVYSKYPKIRLYLNDKLISEKQTTRAQEFKATIPVIYASGILKVVGVENGKEMETKELKTAGKSSKINMKADRTKIQANGQDLIFVTVEITDENGVIQANAENLLNFEVKGAGVIAGVDNGNLKDTDKYLDNKRNAWKGKALVVIRSTKESGEIQLKVSSLDLLPSELTFSTVK